MKFVSYLDVDSPRLGIIVKEQLYDLHNINPFIHEDMLSFFQQENQGIDYAKITAKEIENGQYDQKALKNRVLLAPLPNPKSIRNSFNKTLEGLSFPGWYFGNHHAVTGAGDLDCMQYY